MIFSEIVKSIFSTSSPLEIPASSFHVFRISLQRRRGKGGEDGERRDHRLHAGCEHASASSAGEPRRGDYALSLWSGPIGGANRCGYAVQPHGWATQHSLPDGKVWIIQILLGKGMRIQ
jgi:hypothetical protein